jgi:hypothetical protein
MVGIVGGADGNVVAANASPRVTARPAAAVRHFMFRILRW